MLAFANLGCTFCNHKDTVFPAVCAWKMFTVVSQFEDMWMGLCCGGGGAFCSGYDLQIAGFVHSLSNLHQILTEIVENTDNPLSK